MAAQVCLKQIRPEATTMRRCSKPVGTIDVGYGAAVRARRQAREGAAPEPVLCHDRLDA